MEPIGGIPVLTAEEPTFGPDPATVSINPGTSPGAPAECTCIWTPGPGASPEATADTIAAVLAAIRTGQMGDEHPSREDLTALVFQALYPGYQLGATDGIHIVTPKGTPWFAGPSLGAIARLISDHEYQDAPTWMPRNALTSPPGRDGHQP